MSFENYADRLVSLTNFDIFEKPPTHYKEMSRLTVFQGEMQKKTVTKTKFWQFNDKGFYFYNGITSHPLSHRYLKELVEFKKKNREKNREIFLGGKGKFIGHREQSTK